MTLKHVFATAAILSASTAFADPVTVDTYAGPVTVDTAAQTISVLDVAAIDTLDALGVSIAGVPENVFVDYLDDVTADATKVGSLFEPDFEALAILGTDLIVAGGRSSRRVEELAEIAPTVDMTIWGEDHVAQVLSRVDALAALTGTADAAESIKSDFTAKIEEAKAAVAGKGNALIVLTNGPAVSVYGAGSRFGWLHEALEIPEAVDGVDAQTHGEAVSFEFIADANPDWMIVVDRAAAIGADNQAAEATLDNALVAGTTAAKEGQIVYLNASDIYIAGGGVQSMTRTMDEIIAGFGG